MDANGCGFHVEAIFGNIGITNSRQVRRYNGEFIRKLWNQRLPHPRGLCVAMEKDYGRPVAGREVVNLDSIDLPKPGFNCTGTGLGLAQCCNTRGQEKAEEHSCL